MSLLKSEKCKYPTTKKVGKKINNYLVLSAEFDYSSGKRKTILTAQCNCGNIFKLNLANTTGKRSTKSCGCLTIKHGHSVGKFTRTYSSWDNIKRRTDLKYSQARRSTSKTYRNLIENGNAIDPRWMKFENFLSDMGECPSDFHSIDRIDNSKGYWKHNCRWATQKEQMRNTSRNVWIEWNGKKYVRQDLEKEYKLPKGSLRRRMKSGWTLEQALLTPPSSSNNIKGRGPKRS